MGEAEEEPTFKRPGPAGRVLRELMHEHPQLYAHLSTAWDAVIAHLAPTPTERLLHAVSELLHLCLSQPVGATALPPAVSAAVSAIDQTFHLTGAEPLEVDAGSGPSVSGASMAGGARLADAIRVGLGGELSGAAAPKTLPELVSLLVKWRAKLEAEAAPMPASTQMLEPLCWQLVALQPPLLEVPCQYGDERDKPPALDQHNLIERFDAKVAVRRDPATGETVRVLGIKTDDGSTHHFWVRHAGVVAPHSPLGLERLGQLSRLVNSKLLRAREARRRALMLHVPQCVRLGEGLAIVASGDVPRLSLAAALDGSPNANRLAASSASAQEPLACLLAHYKTLSRAPAGEEERAKFLRGAYEDACAAIPEDALSRALHAHAPSAGTLWQLQRRLASQLGLHALFTYALAMRSVTPEAIVLRRDTGAAELVHFSLPESRMAGGGGGVPAVGPSVPFRLTRMLQQFITPLGIDGPFSGAIGAAAECLANRAKCPLPLWLDALARPEHSSAVWDSEADTASCGLELGIVPWEARGETAATRVRELSPLLLARAAPAKGASADVHAKVRSLVEAATSVDNLSAMPPAFQAWL